MSGGGPNVTVPLSPPLARQLGVSAAVSPDPPVTCLPHHHSTLACRHPSTRMRTTTTTPPHTRRTRHTRLASTVSLPQPGAGPWAWRSPELSTLPPYHDYCTLLPTIITLTTTSTTSSSSTSTITQSSSSKEPWSWTSMNRSVLDGIYLVVMLYLYR